MTNKNQLIIGIVATAIIAGGGAFYGGMQYEKSSLTSQGMLRGAGGNGQFRGGMMGGGGQGQGSRQDGGAARGNGGPDNGGGGFMAGAIFSKDDKSITLKAGNGTTKIVYFSDSTNVGKYDKINISDLNVGDQVMVSGKGNTDGSISAQSIQTRPPTDNTTAQPQQN